MHDAGGMGNAHGFGERAQVGGGLLRRQWTLTQAGRKGTPLHKFHGQIVLALDLTDVMDGHNVGMTQSGGRPCLALEALHGLFAGELPKEQHFERDETIELGMTSAKDDTHSAMAKFFQQFVIAKLHGPNAFLPRSG